MEPAKLDCGAVRSKGGDEGNEGNDEGQRRGRREIGSWSPMPRWQ